MSKFKVSMAERKVKMKAEEHAEFAKLEAANKELCSKTQITSESNNKKSVQLWEATIGKLKDHFNAAMKMKEGEKREFVREVCTAIRTDVESTVSDKYKIKIIKAG